MIPSGFPELSRQSPRRAAREGSSADRSDGLPAVSIVIPVFNEAALIAETLSSIQQHVAVPHEILIVYDQDGDTTVPVVRRLLEASPTPRRGPRPLAVGPCSGSSRASGASRGTTKWGHGLCPWGPTIRLVKNSVARGPSGAIRTGFAHAKAPRVLVHMADGSDDASQIPLLIDLVPSRADIACPSRYCPGGSQRLTPSLKTWLPRFGGILLKRLTGIPTQDPTNSYKMYAAPMLHSMRLCSRISFSVTLEIVAKAHCLSYRVVEIPTVWHDRKQGKTNFKLGRSIIAYLPWFSLALLRNRLFQLPTPWVRWLCGAPEPQRDTPAVERTLSSG